jgi:hypothetical protein
VPKRPADLRSLARAYTTRNVEVLAGIAQNGTDENAKVRAIGMLLDRGWGKPVQNHTHGGGEDGTGPIVVEIVHRERTRKKK